MTEKRFWAPANRTNRNAIFVALCLIPVLLIASKVTPAARFLFFFCRFLCYFAILYNLVSICVRVDFHAKAMRVLRWIMRIGFLVWLVSFLFVSVCVLINAYPDDTSHCEYIVVLGAGLNGTEPSLVLRNRLDHAIEMAERLPDAKLILCGGKGNGLISEAEAMHRYLTAHGIDSARCVLEDASRDTAENLQNAAQILEQRGEADAQICIVTSGFHIQRSKLLARKFGLNAVGAPVDMAWYEYQYLAREYFSILIYLIELTGIRLDTSFLQM